ncbi:MAG: hypothetical protein IT548_07490 [Alphaproteobacteria bacterium]|nr:hypothetical protein [Alphaproteobacteria bacterium]
MRLRRSLLSALVCSAALGGTALADQCAWLDALQVDKLKNLEAAGFDGAKSLVRFCAPCGDQTATVTAFDPEKKFEATPEDDSYSSITYGTESVDLAYWYVAKEGAAPVKAAQSLAVMTGCPISDDTPKALDVAPDGKATAAP